MEILFCAVIGYLFGTVNPTYIISKLKGIDIRKSGSGNVGASNALINFGKIIGVFCALFDIGKAFFSIQISQMLFADFEYALPICGVCAIIGHIFPFYMGFKGGKGLACLGGVILAFDWRVFLIMLACGIALVLICDYLCFVPMIGSLAFSAVYLVMQRDIIGASVLLLAFFAIFYKHIINLKRIKDGTEMHFSYLWNKEKELERQKEAILCKENELDRQMAVTEEKHNGQLP